MILVEFSPEVRAIIGVDQHYEGLGKLVDEVLNGIGLSTEDNLTLVWAHMKTTDQVVLDASVKYRKQRLALTLV